MTLARTVVDVARPVVLPARSRVDLRKPGVEEPQLLVLVGRVPELLAPAADPCQAVGELVVGVAALVGPCADARDLGGDPLDAQVGRLRLRAHPLVDEVPVRVAGERDGAERWQGGVGVEREQQRALERGVVEQLVDEAGPALLERDLRGDVVEHLHPRREPGLDGVLHEQPLREGVQGGHRRTVELVEGRGGARRSHRHGAGLPFGHGAGRDPLELAADAIAQLRGGLLGEGDRHDLAHRHVGDGDERDDTVDQRLRLARSCTRLDEHRLVEALGDREPGRSVDADVAIADGVAVEQRRLLARSCAFGLLAERDERRQLGRGALALPLTPPVAGAPRVGVRVRAPPVRPRARLVERAREHTLLDAVDDRTQHPVEDGLRLGREVELRPLELLPRADVPVRGADRSVGLAVGGARGARAYTGSWSRMLSRGVPVL